MNEGVVALGIAMEEERGADLVVNPLLVVDGEGAILEKLRGLFEEQVVVHPVFRRIPDQTGQVLHQGDLALAREREAEVRMAEPALAVVLVEIGQRDLALSVRQPRQRLDDDLQQERPLGEIVQVVSAADLLAECLPVGRWRKRLAQVLLDLLLPKLHEVANAGTRPVLDLLIEAGGPLGRDHLRRLAQPAQRFRAVPEVVGAAGEKHLRLALGRAEDLPQVLQIPAGLRVGDRLVEAVEDQEEVTLPVQMKESLRIKRLRRSEALEVLREKAFESDRGRAPLPQIDQHRSASGPAAFRQLFPRLEGQLGGQPLAEAGFSAAEVAEQSEEGGPRLVQPLENLPGQWLRLDLLTRPDAAFENHVLLHVEPFESGA